MYLVCNLIRSGESNEPFFLFEKPLLSPREPFLAADELKKTKNKKTLYSAGVIMAYD